MQLDTGNQGFALPTVVHPTGTTCIQLEVPNDPAYMQAVLGTLFDLTQWLNWQRDSAHTGTLAAQRMKVMWQAIDFAGNCTLYQIRQDPTDPCIIEASTDGGVTWTPVVDISECVAKIYPPNNPPSFGDPGEQPGGDNPSAGQCFDINVTIQANQKFLIPFPITDGWQITVSDATGAWWDGGEVYWHCYDGGFFQLGHCYNLGEGAFALDPVQSAHHMALILLYPTATPDGVGLIDNTTVTVPGGTGGGNYYIQGNDSDISNNSGSITFHLHVCAPQPYPWEISFDLTQTTGPSSLTFTYGHQGPGFGAFSSLGYGGDYLYAINCSLSAHGFADTLINYMEFQASWQGGHPAPGNWVVSQTAVGVHNSTNGLNVNRPVPAAFVWTFNPPLHDGSNEPIALNWDIAVSMDDYPNFFTMHMSKVIVRGSGTKPTYLP